jgi:hypothetical protein
MIKLLMSFQKLKTQRIIKKELEKEEGYCALNIQFGKERVPVMTAYYNI